jgi:hypothetical protein
MCCRVTRGRYRVGLLQGISCIGMGLYPARRRPPRQSRAPCQPAEGLHRVFRRRVLSHAETSRAGRGDRCHLTGRPRHLDAIGCRIGHNGHDVVVERMRHQKDQSSPIRLAMQSTKRVAVSTAAFAVTREMLDSLPVP